MLGVSALAIRLCEKYEKLKTFYYINNDSEKYIKYIKDGQLYNIYIPLAILRSTHKDCLRFWGKVCDAEV